MSHSFVSASCVLLNGCCSAQASNLLAAACSGAANIAPTLALNTAPNVPQTMVNATPGKGA